MNREQVLEPEHVNLSSSLDRLAMIYRYRDKYEQAEPLYQRALTIDEHELGPVHPSTVRTRKTYTLLLQNVQRDVKHT